MTMRAASLTTVIFLLLTGCGFGESRFNPLNWFGDDAEETTISNVDIVRVVDDRPLVDQVIALNVERTPGGAIIRATGLPPTQGWYDAALVSDSGGDPVSGVLAYTFRAVPPDDTKRVSTTQSRELSVAVAVSNITLANVREIRVTAARNVRSSRR